MSDTTGSSKKSSEKTSSAPAKESGSTGSTGSSGGDGGKSAKESVGGKKEIHYGFFSSVRTPAYRDGWDAIWGGNDGNESGQNRAKRARNKATSKSRAPAAPKPRTVGLSFDDLPAEVRDGLAEAACKKLRRSRASLDKLEEAGAVEWTISVTVDGGR